MCMQELSLSLAKPHAVTDVDQMLIFLCLGLHNGHKIMEHGQKYQ